MRPYNNLFFILFSVLTLNAQTTDLSIAVEARDLSGNLISQAHFYERYQYLITISNTGAGVADATFEFDISSVESVEGAVAQNLLGGAAAPTNINIAASSLTGDLPNMPNSSSLEIVVNVRADEDFLGGTTVTTNVQPPSGTTDVNPATNRSVISIIITERPIDFQISQTQITPVANGALTSWGDLVTYEMTILNNSQITYPLEDFTLSFQNVNRAGTARVTLENLSCASSSGINCPTLNGNIPLIDQNITNQFIYYRHNEEIVFPAGASFTLTATFRVEEGECNNSSMPEPLFVGSGLRIESYVNNTGFNTFSVIQTEALTNDVCPCTDLTTQLNRISPTGSALSSWNDIVTYESVLSNDGSSDIMGGGAFNNISTQDTDFNIISVTCISTTGALDCSDFNININPSTRWVTNVFSIPANSSATFRTTLRFVPAECSIDGVAPFCRVRSSIFERDGDLEDCDESNNSSGNSLTGLPLEPCDEDDDPDNGNSGDLIGISEVQTTPSPGAGPYPYGEIRYEIIMSNVDTLPHRIKFKDIQASGRIGILRSIACIATTGGATCPTSFNANIDVPNGTGDTFWEILETDNFIMPPESSITYEKTIDWTPECRTTIVNVLDDLEMSAIDDALEILETVTAGVSTPMVPCVDLVVQTYPSVTSAAVNESLEWVVDITNSNVSVDASNISFNSLLHPDFAITGTPTCALSTGIATCISSFTVIDNQITGTIPFMESGATLQVRIPVTAPDYGGSFENRAEAQPDFSEQGETTPSSNISITSLFVLTSQTSKSFDPSIITRGETSILSFTITNSDGQSAQNNISFTDNLPASLTLVSEAFWIAQNGATANFIDTIGSSLIGVENLSFPAGTSEISFGVEVTSIESGVYVNDFQNFSNLFNIDVSTTFASIEILPIHDLSVIKTVDNAQPDINDLPTFSIIVENLGDITATDVIVNENLPSGYTYVSHNLTAGTFDTATGIWAVGEMLSGSSETLELTVTLNIPGDFNNVVTVSSSNAQEELRLDNNMAEAFTLPDCIKVPEGFTPNGDSTNDTFEIQCIDSYPGNELKIFNRYGNLVHKASDYQNDWDGRATEGLLHQNGELLPVGTYYWYLDLHDGSQIEVGWLYLNY
ncbi:MAG: gliding motility-associated C-terminal domain-containing protein [Nonlabens sp.]